MNVTWDYNSTVEAYRPLYGSKAKINLVWGSRDSGKSHSMAHVLVEKCLFEKQFRCIMTRAVQETVRTSNYAEIVGAIEELGLSELFSYNKSDLQITNKINGNFFIGIGSDNPAKIKSFKNPTDIWGEESDQLKEEAIDIILTTLRNNEVECQAWFTLNPEINPKTGKCDILDKFLEGGTDNIERYYCDQTEPKLVEWNKEIEFLHRGELTKQTLTYLSLHTMLDHNPYCPPERAVLYESYKSTNPNKYNVWRFGKLGINENESPFFNSFDYEVHVVADKIKPNRDHPILLTFDFNVDPCTCVVMQLIKWDCELDEGLYIFDVIQVNGGTEKLCNEIKALGYHQHWGGVNVTGDCSGSKRHTSSSEVDYDIIKRVLDFTGNQFYYTEGRNSAIIRSRDLCNYVLYHVLCTFVSPACDNLIREMQVARRDKDGKLYKNRDQGHSHDASDAFRYGINFFFFDGVEDGIHSVINYLNQIN